MAKKLDKHILDAARTENSKQRIKPTASAAPISSAGVEDIEFLETGKWGENQTPPVQTAAETAPGATAPGASDTGATAPGETPPASAPAAPVVDEFQAQFDEYFKGMDGLIAGEAVVEMVDDLKCSALLLYARKHGISLEKKDMEMNEKSKKFTAFLVDYAIKNKAFVFLKKYPLAAAGIVVAISAGSTYAMLTMLKKSNDSAAAQAKKIKDLEQKLKDAEISKTE